jgi:nucleotide-binding universal stress UspA family protein
MEPKLFHIWRNTPLGRETLLQSLYFCNTVSCSLTIYIPRHTKFLMYFDNDVVQIDLDESYLNNPDTALENALALAEEAGIKPFLLEPKNFTASTLPDIPTHFDFMCCPRSISDLSSKIGLGYIGPRVRRIVQSARFPVLVTSPAYKTWSRIAVFFGGSANAVKALRLGLSMKRRSGLPLEIYTQMEKKLVRSDYEKVLEQAGLTEEVEKNVHKWHLFESGEFMENLYNIPHDALVVLGAYGHSLIRDFVFGSKMELIQSEISNNLLIAGPNATTGL